MTNETKHEIYTAENCGVSYKLYWSLSLFTNRPMPIADEWLPELEDVVERDGVRILEYAHRSDATHQFLLSTKPTIAPSAIIKSVKGRLQHSIRQRCPQAFRRNYSIKSVGPATVDVIKQYVATQLDHHKMADPRVQARLPLVQIHISDVNLDEVRRSSHGEFIYNLHIVMTHQDRWNEIRDEVLQSVRGIILQTAQERGHLLSEAGIIPDHHHLALGCEITESPVDVALIYMNNLALVHGNVPVFEKGFFVGTFGPFDLNAVRLANGKIWS